MSTRNDRREALLQRAREVARQAYAPYSRLKVGAVIRAASGAVYVGANVENAAFPLGHCAEASAIAAGVSAEGADLRIAEVAVHAEGADGNVVAASPCGGCRQRLHEFAAGEGVTVHFHWDRGPQTLTLDELLPYSFEFPRGSRSG